MFKLINVMASPYGQGKNVNPMSNTTNHNILIEPPSNLKKIFNAAPFDERKNEMKSFISKMDGQNKKRHHRMILNHPFIIKFKEWIIKNILAPNDDQWFVRHTQKKAEDAFMEKIQPLTQHGEAGEEITPTRTHVFYDAVAAYMNEYRKNGVIIERVDDQTCVIAREKIDKRDQTQKKEIIRIQSNSKDVKINSIPCDFMDIQENLKKRNLERKKINKYHDKEMTEFVVWSNRRSYNHRFNNDSSEYDMRDIIIDIFTACYTEKETVLDLSLQHIGTTKAFQRQCGKINDKYKLTSLPKSMDSLYWVDQLNIEGHDVSVVQIQNMSSLHTLRARNSGIIEFTLKNMPLLTILDISDNNNLDTVNIRKALVPNLKHLFIDADKVHLLEKCDLPDDCTVYVKNISRVGTMETLKEKLAANAKTPDEMNRLMQKLKAVEPEDAFMEVREGQMVIKAGAGDSLREIECVDVPVLPFCDDLNEWAKEEARRNPDNTDNIDKAVYSIKSAYADVNGNKKYIYLHDMWLTSLPVTCLEKLLELNPDLKIHIPNHALDEYPESLKDRLAD